MAKRQRKPESAEESPMVMADCGHPIEQERWDKGYHWCKRPGCVATYAAVVRTRTDWETGATWEEESDARGRAWLREEGPPR
jgi:hypothetical protein